MAKLKIDAQQTVPAFAAIYGVGLAPLLILPFLFSVLISGFGLSEVDAGATITYALIAMCVGSLGVAPLVHRLSHRLLAVAGCVLSIIGNALICLSVDANYLTPLLLLSGGSAGVALAAGNAAVAATTEPEKNYNHVVLFGTVLFILLLFLVPRAMGFWSYQGVFGVLAILSLLMAPILFGLPKENVESAVSTDSHTKVSLYSLVSIFVLGLVFLYFVRDTMIWVYAEHIGGTRFNLSSERVAWLFTIHGLLSLLGPLALLWVASRVNAGALLLTGIALTGAITIAISQTTSVEVYSAMVIVWAMVHFFTYSCFMGLASRVDASGRVVAAAGGGVLAGNAVAPALASSIVDQGGYPMLGWALLILVLLTAACAILALWQAD